MIWVSEKVFDLCGTNGFYIECGANDGIRQSNTYRLEKEKGWKGLLIEASPSAFELCKQNRSPDNIFVNKAMVSPERSNWMVTGDFTGDLRGKIGGGNILVEGITLNSVLRANNITKVDFFSLDVEGYELEVLKGIDFSYCSPEMILIEIWESEKDVLFGYMQAGYENGVNLSGFTKETHPDWNGQHNDYLFRHKNS